MFSRSPYSSSKSRTTKRDQNHIEINEQIVILIASSDAPRNAESIWLDLKSNGMIISMSSVYNRLKNMFDEGIIEKRSVGYNKYEYTAVAQKQSID